MRNTAFATMLLAVTFGAPAGLAGQQQFQWNGRVAEGRSVEVRGINGGITAVAAAGAEVRVSATKQGSRSNPDEVRVEVVQHDGGVTICAIYPSPPGRPENRCEPGGRGGHNQVRNNDVEVHFTVQVPRGVHFVGRTVNGAITGTDLPANADGRTVNGAVTLTTAGIARAATVNGAVDVTMGRADWDGRLELETVNGGLTVRFRTPLNAEVTASTVSGAIDTELPLQVVGRFGPRRVTGTVGSGGRTLVLRTVNGGIRIHQ
jgi:hypothetical protein